MRYINLRFTYLLTYLLTVNPLLLLLILLLLLPRAGSGVVRMDLLRFLAGCCTRRLNQV